MKSFEEQVKEYRASASSLSSLSSETNSYFKEKYGLNSNGGEEKFISDFIPGKIYTGEYLTKTEISSRVKYINRYPTFFFIGSEKLGSGVILKSIDFSVIPPEYRGQIIMRLFNQFFGTISQNENNMPSSQEAIRISSLDLNNLLNGTGYQTSVTGFKREYLRGIKIIDYLDWCKIPYLSDFSVQGLPLNTIYNDYRSKLNR